MSGWRGLVGAALYRPAHVRNDCGPRSPTGAARPQLLRRRTAPPYGHNTQRRLSAEDLTSRLQGMCLLALATVTRDCRPLIGPVDGIFYSGAFYFGSSPARSGCATSPNGRRLAPLIFQARNW